MGTEAYETVWPTLHCQHGGDEAGGVDHAAVGAGLAALLPIGLLSWYAVRLTSQAVRDLVQANNLSAPQ